MASLLKGMVRRVSGGKEEAHDGGIEKEEEEGVMEGHDKPLEAGFDLGGGSGAGGARAYLSDIGSELQNVELPLTGKQLAAVKELRERCAEDLAQAAPFPEVVGDLRILRFLRGHKFNIEVASEMYRGMLRWRKRHGVDAVRQQIVQGGLRPCDYPGYERFVRYYPSAVDVCRDKKGRPVAIERVGAIQPKKMMSSFSLAEWLRFHIFCCEYTSLTLQRLSDQQGRLVRILLLYDLEGCGPQHLRTKAGIDTFRRTVAITQDNYPETMEDCFLVNVPRIFTMAWALLKSALAERTVSKIQILGSKDMHRLQAVVDNDQLPVSFFGSLPNTWPLLPRPDADKDFEHLEVPRGAKRRVSFTAPPDAFVTWGFFTRSGDITVHVVHAALAPADAQRQMHQLHIGEDDTTEERKEGDEQDDDRTDGAEHVQRVERTDSAGGSLLLDKHSSARKFTITFDNSFSWVTRKHVHFYIRLGDRSHHVPLTETR
jgi:hypothetical protein